jgi:hypothetical protein
LLAATETKLSERKRATTSFCPLCEIFYRFRY